MTQRIRQIVILSDTKKSNLYNRFLLRLGFPILPLKLANIDRDRSSDRTDLNRLAEEVDLNTPEYRDLIAKHDSKLSKIRWFHFVVLLALFYALLYYIHEVFIGYVFWVIISFLLAITKPIEFPIIAAISIFISIFWLNRRTLRGIIKGFWQGLYEKYGESFCTREALSILGLLKDDNIMDDEDRKQDVSKRMMSLADTTKIIGEEKARKYPGNKTKKRQIKEHYKRMALEIEERAFWLTIPGDTTLYDLREDFNEFAHIYITGEFGNFKWQDTQENKTNWEKVREAIALIKEAIPIINPVISGLKAIGKIIKPFIS